MRQAADHYFRITESNPENPFMNNQRNPLDRRRCGGEKKVNREGFAGAYGGLERRRGWREKQLSRLPKERENGRDDLIATYWG